MLGLNEAEGERLGDIDTETEGLAEGECEGLMDSLRLGL
jgi:hypothetical protein